MENIKKKVVVLGASDKPHRYSHMAVLLLKEHGYPVIPVHPRLLKIEGFPIVPDLKAVREKVHTLTVYVGPQRIGPMIDDIVSLKPERVILNPGAESEELEKRLSEAGIPFLEACTLVMLNSGQF